MPSTYEHYFLSDTSKVVSHKPVNLVVVTACGGVRRVFTCAIKTSEDKIKRRLNKTVALKQCFICCDDDPAYMERRAEQEAAAMQQAALEAGEADAGGSPHAPPTKSQLAARLEQQNYIGSKELFTSHPGGGIVCLRLRAAEEPNAKKSRSQPAYSSSDDSSHVPPTPLPADVSEAGSDGFLFSVETKGGKSAGRQKQRYVLLKRSCIYSLLLPSDITVVKIETKDKHGATVPIKHWISTHAQLASPSAPPVTKFAPSQRERIQQAQQEFVAATAAALANTVAPSNLFGAPHSLSPQQQAALLMGTMSNLMHTSNISPFSSQSVSPANGGAFASITPPLSNHSGSNGISPANSTAANDWSPQQFLFQQRMQQQALAMQQQQQQQQHLFASTVAALSASSAAFPSPSDHLMMMLPPSNNSSPTSLLVNSGVGVGSSSMFVNPFTQPSLLHSAATSTSLLNPHANIMLPNLLNNSVLHRPNGFPSADCTTNGANSSPPSTERNSEMMTSDTNGEQQQQQQPHQLQQQQPHSPPPQSIGAQRLQQQIEQLQSLLQQQKQLEKQQQDQQRLQQQHQTQLHAFLQNHAMMQQQQPQPPQPHSFQQPHRPMQMNGSMRKAFDFTIRPPQPLLIPSFASPQQRHHPNDPLPPAQPQHAAPLSTTSTTTVRTHDPALYEPMPLSAEPSPNTRFFQQQQAIIQEDEVDHQQQQQQQHATSTHLLRQPLKSDSTIHASMADSPQNHLSSSALHNADWNPPNPLAHASFASGSPSEVAPMSPDDFLNADLFREPQSDVPASFFASSPLLQDSADSSSSSHASHSPRALPLSHSSAPFQAVTADPTAYSASNLAAALRPPVFPLFGGSANRAHSSSSSVSGGSDHHVHVRKRKNPSAVKKRRSPSNDSSSATSSVVSESDRRGTGYSLSPRQWKIALKKPPFRATLSVTRGNVSGRFKPTDHVQVCFGGTFLDATKVDVYHKQILIDIPPPPTTSALLPGGVDASSLTTLPHATIEVDLELHVNGQLKFASTFSYKLGPASHHLPTGDATTSDSSDSDSSDDEDDDRSSDSPSDDESFGQGGRGSRNHGGTGEGPDQGGDSKRQRGNGAGGPTDGSGQGGSYNHSGSQLSGGNDLPAVRLVADFDSIPLFSRGVLKNFPLLSLGLQELLQSYLLSVAPQDDTSASSAAAPAPPLMGATVEDCMIMEEETDEGADGGRTSPLPRKRQSTGARGVEKLKAMAAKAEASAGGSVSLSPSLTPKTPSRSSPLRPSAERHVSASARTAARIQFLQAITSRKPQHFLHAALSAATQAALQCPSGPALNNFDSFGFTLLHYAIAAGVAPFVEKLLALGANPHLQARSSHASHAFTPAQLLQLRLVDQEERDARRVARAAKRTAKALVAGSSLRSSPTDAVSSAHSSPLRKSRHEKKKRRTSDDGDESASVASNASNASEGAHHSSSEGSEAAMADAHELSPRLIAHQPLFAGFSSLHSLAATPFASAHTSANNSLCSTPTNAALQAARVNLTGRDILASTQPRGSKFHFGVTAGEVKTSPIMRSVSPEKLLHAGGFQLPAHPQHASMHVYHMQQQQHMPTLESKLMGFPAQGGSSSTATTAAPTPSNHFNSASNSVLPSPSQGVWRSSPASASPQQSPLANLHAMPEHMPLTVAEANKAMSNIMRVYTISPQGLALAASQSQAHFAQSAATSSQPQSAAPISHNCALTPNPQLEACVQRRWTQARWRAQGKKHLAHLQQQLRVAQGLSPLPPQSPSFAQSEEDREQQRELVMLELAMAIQLAQKHMAALKLEVPASASSTPVTVEPHTLSTPMQSLHMHTLRGLLQQFHILRRYYTAYRKHQQEQTIIGNLAADIHIDENTAAAKAAPATTSSPTPTSAAAPSSPVKASLVPFNPFSTTSAPTAALSSSAAGAFANCNDESILALFAHVGAVESTLRDQVVYMQRTLAPFMQRALLQTKMHNERMRAQNKIKEKQARASATSSHGAAANVASPDAAPLAAHSLRPAPPRKSTGPLSQGHLSRTSSGQLSLNILSSIHPDREDNDEAIRIREVHAVDVIEGRRIDLVVNPQLEAQESAANAARDSARRASSRSNSRLTSPSQPMPESYSSTMVNPAATAASSHRLAVPAVLAPHPSPSASVVSTPAGARPTGAFHFPQSSSSAMNDVADVAPVGHKFALLIGINQYDPSLGVSPLLGCENDVQRMSNSIRPYGFDPAVRPTSEGESVLFGPHVRTQVLMNQHATRHAVRQVVAALVAAAQSPTDSVLVYFAGHGFEKSVLLYDGVLPYEELIQLMANIATKDCTFVSDTCATEQTPSSLLQTAASSAAPDPMQAATAAATSLNTSLTLEEMRRLVDSCSSTADDASSRADAARAAAEVLAGLSPADSAPHRLRMATPAASPRAEDAAVEADESGDSMDESDAHAPIPPSIRRKSGGARVHYRGLAFNKVEPLEPASEMVAVPHTGRRTRSDELDVDPTSSEPCRLPSDADDSDAGSPTLERASSRVIPVIQRLLTRRGYFARGLLSQTDKRASEVRTDDGTWHGAYTARLCTKLEQFAVGKQLSISVSENAVAEPANPRMISLRAILFHDEAGGNLSERDGSGSSAVSCSSTRSNSVSLPAGAPPLIAEVHQTDEIDPSSSCAEVDSMLLPSPAADDDAPLVASSSIDTDVSSSSSGDEDSNGDDEAACCAASIAAACAETSHSSDDEEDDEESIEPLASHLFSPCDDGEEPSDVVVGDDTAADFATVPVTPRFALFALLLAFLARLIAAPFSALQRTWGQRPVVATEKPVLPAAADVALPKESPPRLGSLSSPSVFPPPCSSLLRPDVVTTEAPSDDSGSSSSGDGARCRSSSHHAALVSDSDGAPLPPETHKQLPRTAPVGAAAPRFMPHW